MEHKDPFPTFKVWRKSATQWYSKLDEIGLGWESAIHSRIPRKAREGTAKFFGFLEKHLFATFCLFFLLVCSRAIHWLIEPQFYIEDGKEFYAPAFNLGLGTITRDYASYYHVVPRILSLLAAMLHPRFGPIAMELFALAIQAAAAAFLMSRRLAAQFPSAALRFGLGFVVIAYPYSNELFGNIAHSQWYLAILSLAIVCSEPGKRLTSRLADYMTLAFNCLTGPFAPVIALIAWSNWRGDKKRFAAAITASLCAGITLYMLHGKSRFGVHRSSRFSLFERVISNQVVLGPIRGFHYVYQIPYTPFFDLREFFIALFGVLVITMGMRYAPVLIRALTVLGLFSFLSSLIAGGSWAVIGDPGVGERYFLHIGLALIFCLYAISVRANFSPIRWLFRAILGVCALAIVQNWVYDPPFARFDYPPQIAAYDRLKPGQKLQVTFPIDRKLPTNFWEMELTKK